MHIVAIFIEFAKVWLKYIDDLLESPPHKEYSPKTKKNRFEEGEKHKMKRNFSTVPFDTFFSAKSMDDLVQYAEEQEKNKINGNQELYSNSNSNLNLNSNIDSS